MYLVTGGAGFLGSALVRRLLKDGHAVRVLDDCSRGSARRLERLAGKLEFVKGDIRDAGTVREAASGGVRSVVHLAFVNGTELFYRQPELVLDVGVRGMMNVLEACRKNNVPELILSSSSEVYQTPPAVPTDETVPLSIPDPLNPRYSYAAGKIISEIMALNYGRTGFERVVIVRPHNVYGPDMGWEHVVPQFILRMKDLCTLPTDPIAFPIQGTGSETRAFVYIDDFIEGLMCLLERGRHLEIYHVGTEEELTIAEVARVVGTWFGRSVSVVPGPVAPGSTPRRCPSISKLRALGYRPRYSFAEGLPIAASWYCENAHLAPLLSSPKENPR